MQKLINRLTNARTVPFALLFFSIASFGILIPTLGFYWDDWPMIWFGQLTGSAGYVDALAGDRPFLAGIYVLTTSILGTSPLPWHILALLSRWITALTLWWTLKKLWPEQEEKIAWIALLFAIYPGFKQQSIAVIYANGFFLLTAQFLSFGLMLHALQTSRKYWPFTFLAMFSLAACAFSTEYYIGLEMVRPILLWLALSNKDIKTKQRLMGILKHWAPYIAVITIYLIWRVFIFAFPTYQPDTIESLTANPITSGVMLFNTVLQDIFTASWQAWSSTFHFPSLTQMNSQSAILSWITIFSTASLAIFYLLKLRLFPPTTQQSDTMTSSVCDATTEKNARMDWNHQAMLLGGIALLFSGAPYWVTGLPVQLRFPWDRFTLSFMFGSVIFIIGLIDWLFKTRVQKIILIGLMIGMACGANLNTANSFRRDWLAHNDFFWQLAWRAPALKPGTSILTHELPLNYYSDNSLTAPLNWIYAPDNHSENIPYFLGFTTVRLGHSIPGFEENLPIRQSYRSATFSSTTSQSVVIFYSPPGCLKVISPAYNANLPLYPDTIKKAFAISHPNQILRDTEVIASPPAQIFGTEPEHTWCYFYQKADLARQYADWAGIYAIGEEAFSLKYYPEEFSELYPFIEGYAKTGNWPRALELVKDVNVLGSQNLTEHTCRLMNRLYEEIPPKESDIQAEFENVWFERLHCLDYFASYQ